MRITEKIEEQAAHWVVRLERGLTAPEQDELLHWLLADPRHGGELSRQKTSWLRLNTLADWRPEHGPRPNRDLLAPAGAADARRPHRLWHWSAPMGLAAAAVIAFVLFSERPERTTPTVPVSLVTLPPPIATIERRTLEDGSVIELNRGAEIAVHYSATDRNVRLLRGEALFEVAKDAARPFVVSVEGIDVRAVGTVFNVSLGAASVEVLVTEGRVHVHPPASTAGSGQSSHVTPPAVLHAGHRAVVSLAPGASNPTVNAVTSQQAAQRLAWRPRLLDFTEAPLQAVVDEFNRRNAPIRIIVADPTLADTVVSASLRSDNIEGFIRLMEGGFGVSAQRHGNSVTLSTARVP